MNTLPKDPVMLLSVVNTALRDHYSTLSALCEDYDVSENEIVDKLSAINYVYDPDKNQFK